ncbi:hydrogen peroxide-inducible genes activator [Xanthobacter autotrophicus]|uniref:hydrogen peroxide-inducible genes activator n=1 Tax=Xanthobacter autotrophicus TaxID=280 RepID=UPI0024A78760|nr:hydrogen peroxide-inducible genes activator [Xanthobacter autotrophicus]MDI4658297.1 hydrogen peroxide-inducible genes activator [Xanthobacter autotrophicus]
MLSIRQLRYFEALARHRHFGRAAEDCAVTQPALSMQIREMEEAAGRARGVLAALADMERTIRESGRLLEGRLRLGVIASIAPYLLPRLLPEMARRHPGLEIALRESQTEHLVTDLVQGDLDLVILSLPVEHPALEAMALFEDRFVLAVPEASPDFQGPKASADSILAADLLLLEDGHCLRDQALNVCRKVDARQLRRFGASSLATLAQLVANGQGITLLPDMFVRAEGGRMAGVRLLPFPDPVPARTIGLVWRRTLPHREDVAAVADMVKACRPGA